MKLPTFLIIVLIAIIIMLASCFVIFKTGYEVDKRSAIANSMYPEITDFKIQEELTDFADKQREFYKKTHNEY